MSKPGSVSVSVSTRGCYALEHVLLLRLVHALVHALVLGLVQVFVKALVQVLVKSCYI